MESHKLRIWLEKLAEQHGWGRGKTVRLGELTGLHQSYVSRLLRDELEGDISTKRLEKMADHMGRDPEDLLAEIMGDRTIGKQPHGKSSVVVPIDARYQREWDRLFQGNPARAKRVLKNMVLQERHGYTDLVSRIVNLIIERGPEGAAAGIGYEIEAFTRKSKKSRPSAGRKKKRTTH